MDKLHKYPEIIREIANQPDMSTNKLARFFKVPPTTMRQYIRNNTITVTHQNKMSKSQTLSNKDIKTAAESIAQIAAKLHDTCDRIAIDNLVK